MAKLKMCRIKKSYRSIANILLFIFLLNNCYYHDKERRAKPHDNIYESGHSPRKFIGTWNTIKKWIPLVLLASSFGRAYCDEAKIDYGNHLQNYDYMT